MKTPPSLRQRALNILARREISRAELAKKLQAYCEDADELQALLDDLAARHWQSDARYAEAYVHSKAPRHGHLRLRQTLSSQGVDEDLIRAVLPDRDSETAHAVAVLRKKFKQPPADSAERYKQMRFLAYRGFDSDTVRRALEQAWLADEDNA